MFSLILHGRRSVELQKWRNLRVYVKYLQNASTAFANSSSSTNASPQGNTFTVSYLVESLGLSTKLAQAISKKVSLDEKENPDSVLNLLRTHGFDPSQISRIIRGYPRLLTEDAETCLGPKLQLLLSRGASASELTEIVSKVPKILGKKSGKSVSLYYGFVKDIMQDDAKLCQSSWPEGQACNRIRNISVLRELGVPQNLLLSLLITNGQPVCGREKFQETLKKVVAMGFDPAKPEFVEALHVIYEMKDYTRNKKVKVYKGLGFSEADIWKTFKKWPYFLKFSEKKITKVFKSLKKCGLEDKEVLLVLKSRPQCLRYSDRMMLHFIETFLGLGFSRDDIKMMIRRYPPCIGYSPESLKKKFEFLVTEMNWPLEALVLMPTVFGYSLEKRTVPRCNVIKALMSKGLMGSVNPRISSVLICTDHEFLSRYVTKHDNKKLVLELMGILTRDK